MAKHHYRPPSGGYYSPDGVKYHLLPVRPVGWFTHLEWRNRTAS